MIHSLVLPFNNNDKLKSYCHFKIRKSIIDLFPKDSFNISDLQGIVLDK